MPPPSKRQSAPQLRVCNIYNSTSKINLWVPYDGRRGVGAGLFRPWRARACAPFAALAHAHPHLQIRKARLEQLKAQAGSGASGAQVGGGAGGSQDPGQKQCVYTDNAQLPYSQVANLSLQTARRYTPPSDLTLSSIRGPGPRDSNHSHLPADARKSILDQILHPEAADRLGRIRLVKESRATDVENRLIMLARSGQLRQKVTEDQLKELLNNLADNAEEEKIVVSRRKAWDDDDDDLLDL